MKNHSTGPRTPQGKARSCRNARKHLIFFMGILAEEEEQAASLYAAYCKDLQPKTTMGHQKIGELVQNRLRKDRIDEYEAHQFKMACVQRDRKRTEKHNQRQTNAILRLADPSEAAWDMDRDRLPPEYCIDKLSDLHRSIATESLAPDEYLCVLDLIYGKGVTPLAAAAILRFKKLISNQHHSEDRGTKGIPEGERKLILEILDKEIEHQEHWVQAERDYENVECGPDSPVLPPDHVLDRIAKYRTANGREFDRILEAYERVERLGHGKQA